MCKFVSIYLQNDKINNTVSHPTRKARIIQNKVNKKLFFQLHNIQ